jgi:hypothetical protein
MIAFRAVIEFIKNSHMTMNRPQNAIHCHGQPLGQALQRARFGPLVFVA